MGAHIPPASSLGLKAGRGRPPTWSSPEDMLEAGRAYFDDCMARGEILTIAGLALSLDLSYQGLNEYEDKPIFSATVKKLKTQVLHQCEKRFYDPYPTGPIWHSKQLGFKDRSEVTNTGTPSNVTEIHLPMKES